MRAGGHAHPKGLVLHVGARRADGGLFITDVWESEEAFKEFGKILMPIIQKQGLNAQPEMMSAYYVYEAKGEEVMH